MNLLKTDADRLHDQAADAAACGDLELSNDLMDRRGLMLKKDLAQGNYSLGNNPRFHPS